MKATCSRLHLEKKTAHQIVNTGSQELRYLGVSTIGSVDVLE